MSRRFWRWALVGLVVAGFTAGLMLPLSAFALSAVSDLTLVVVPVGAGWACIVRSRHAAADRRGWFLLGLSCCC